MIQRDGLPETPEWSPEARLEPDFTRADLVPTPSPCALCKQRLDGRGDQ